jgi:hypothetical protein
MVNWALDYFSFDATLPRGARQTNDEAQGVQARTPGLGSDAALQVPSAATSCTSSSYSPPRATA